MIRECAIDTMDDLIFVVIGVPLKFLHFRTFMNADQPAPKSDGMLNYVYKWMRSPLKALGWDNHRAGREKISGISNKAVSAELGQRSFKYHITGTWVAILFNPLFAITDYINIPQHWKLLFVIRLCVSLVTFATWLGQKRFGWASHTIVSVPFLLISIQNCIVYSLITNSDLLGQNLNYIALLLGAALFLLWDVWYSIIIVLISASAMVLSLHSNPAIDLSRFFVQGGLLLITMAAFMIIMIQSRYNLTVKEIKARLALYASNEEIRQQAEEIKGINENLEMLVKERTRDLERKNKALEEYAFINAHKLRSPVASILGLLDLMDRVKLDEEGQIIRNHMHESTQKLDSIIASITEVIEEAEKASSGGWKAGDSRPL